MATDPARLVAFDVLHAVADQDAYANIELSRMLRERRLSARDAAFATELVGGTLRMRGAYDAVIAQLVDRDLDDPVRDALRLGVHQLLSMRVPTHAAVGTTVDLVKKRIGHRPSGLVNAVLRKVADRTLEDWLAGHPMAERGLRRFEPIVRTDDVATFEHGGRALHGQARERATQHVGAGHGALTSMIAAHTLITAKAQHDGTAGHLRRVVVAQHLVQTESVAGLAGIHAALPDRSIDCHTFACLTVR